MNNSLIVLQGFKKVLFNLFPGFLAIAVGLAYIFYTERRCKQ